MQRSGQLHNLIVAICLFATACSPPPAAGDLVAGAVAPYYPLNDPLVATKVWTAVRRARSSAAKVGDACVTWRKCRQCSIAGC
jgi:hypothetical protein